MSDALTFPFVAVSGQALLKLALTLITINPTIGGVLISGPRGSAKTTLARGVSQLMPEQGQFVTLPLGASEEMLIGSLDLQQVLQDQHVKFNPGLLAKAHQGVLYVDEVNLLPDALVDQLLDVAVSRVNIIERDGVSHQHPADFLLIGTMNPDEGELRPQLQDRFGLSVQLNNQYSIDERMEIVQLREAFDRSPTDFIAHYADAQRDLIQQIQTAQIALGQMSCSVDLRRVIAERCHAANVDGMRGDIVWYRAALAHAAWRGHPQVQLGDIDTVEPLVLGHRRNEQSSQTQSQSPSTPPPFTRPPQPPSDQSHDPSRGQSPNSPIEPPHCPKNSSFQNKPPSQDSQPENNDNNETPENSSDDSQGDNGETNNNAGDDWGGLPPQQQQAQQAIKIALNPIITRSTMKPKRLNQTNSRLIAGKQKGDHVGGSRQGKQASSSIDWFHTLSSNAQAIKTPAKISGASGHTVMSDAHPNTLLPATPWKWHFKKARAGKRVLHLILLDTSASTLAEQAFAKSKGVVLQIAEQAYLLREQLAVMSFGHEQVKWLLAQVRAPKQLTPLLNQTPAGGGTPLRDVLIQAQHYLLGVKRKNPDISLHTYLLTDGRTRQSFDGLQLEGHCTVINTEQSAVKRGRARDIATALGAEYLSINTSGTLS